MPAGHPGVGADRQGPTFDDTRAWVEAVAHGGRSGARAGQLGVEVRARKGLARLDFTQNACNKTLVALQASALLPAHRCRCRSPGTSSTTPSCAPTAGRSAYVGERLASVGDPSPSCWTARSLASSLAPAVGQHAPGRAPTLPAMRGAQVPATWATRWPSTSNGRGTR